MNYLIKSVIFDFNGTLFHDSHLHTEAWVEISKHYRKKPFTFRDVEVQLMGRTNYDIISILLNRNPSVEELNTIMNKKENYYRNLVLNSKTKPMMEKFSEPLFNFLRQQNIQYTIATSSGYDNLAFFINIFQLEKWFHIPDIIYDNGTFKGKPSGDIYMLALKQINAESGTTVVFEDAIAGLEAARSAGIERRVLIDTSGIKNVVQQGLAWEIIDTFEDVLKNPERFFN